MLGSFNFEHQKRQITSVYQHPLFENLENLVVWLEPRYADVMERAPITEGDIISFFSKWEASLESK